MTLACPFQYLSVWALLLVVFARYTHRRINLLLLTSVVLAGAFAIFYVHPRRLKLRCFGKDVTRPGQLLAIDLLFHWLPFAVVLTVYGPHYRAAPWGPSAAATCFLLAVYVLVGDFPGTSDADPHLSMLAVLLGVVLYAVCVG